MITDEIRKLAKEHHIEMNDKVAGFMRAVLEMELEAICLRVCFHCGRGIPIIERHGRLYHLYAYISNPAQGAKEGCRADFIRQRMQTLTPEKSDTQTESMGMP